MKCFVFVQYDERAGPCHCNTRGEETFIDENGAGGHNHNPRHTYGNVSDFRGFVLRVRFSQLTVRPRFPSRRLFQYSDKSIRTGIVRVTSLTVTRVCTQKLNRLLMRNEHAHSLREFIGGWPTDRIFAYNLDVNFLRDVEPRIRFISINSYAKITTVPPYYCIERFKYSTTCT